MRSALITAATALLLAAQSASAVDLDLDCPNSATVGSSVAIDMTLSNDECFAFTFPRTFVGIVGNTDDSAGGVGIFGPFARPNSGTIPTATCEGGFPVFPEVPGVLGPVSVTITTSVPASLVGTVAAMVVSVEATGTPPIGDVEETFASDSCPVEITPP